MTEQERRSDSDAWAKPTPELHVSHDLPPQAINRNVEGRRVLGVAGGFGKMWQKTYTIDLAGVDATPADVIREWRAHFPEFWPKGAYFFAPLTGVSPGDVVPINIKMPGGMKLLTGIMVIYADDESFSYLMPEGGMFGGMITFRAFKADGVVRAEVQATIRAQDPIYEVAMMFGGHRMEDKQWLHVLSQLATHLGATGTPQMQRTLVDRKRQWKQFGNVRKNAAIRSAFYPFGAPKRALQRRRAKMEA